ncbi:MAG TPA: hypothetical protein VE967_09360, partial [Gemmatimonadaceae bacterium]|nr:hypothetical protein [Gemmatimonadaceae bacterium]
IVEGDRIAKINSVDLRVPATDAGDPDLARARLRRFTQEISGLKAGGAATLTVVSGGRQREVRVTAVKQSELKNDDDGFSYFFGPGNGAITIPRLEQFNFPNGRGFQVMPNGGNFFYRGDIKGDDLREQVEKALEQARKSLDGIRGDKEIIRAPIKTKPIVKKAVVRT